MTRSSDERLVDIRAAIERCLSYRDYLGSEELGAMAYDAVLRNLAVIGEAVKGLPDAFKKGHPEVPWPSIAGLRNIVIHEYFRVNPDVIRDILSDPLTELAAVVASHSGASEGLVPTFVESPSRGIDLSLGSAWPGFNETLADSVTSLPPRGDSSTDPSTYWIDLLIARLENWIPEPGEEIAILSGNACELVRAGSDVIARSLYELFDDERIPVGQLLPLARDWRARVIQAGGTYDIPETYRRTPFFIGGDDR